MGGTPGAHVQLSSWENWYFAPIIHSISSISSEVSSSLGHFRQTHLTYLGTLSRQSFSGPPPLSRRTVAVRENEVSCEASQRDQLDDDQPPNGLFFVGFLSVKYWKYEIELSELIESKHRQWNGLVKNDIPCEESVKPAKLPAARKPALDGSCSMVFALPTSSAMLLSSPFFLQMGLPGSWKWSSSRCGFVWKWENHQLWPSYGRFEREKKTNHQILGHLHICLKTNPRIWWVLIWFGELVIVARLYHNLQIERMNLSTGILLQDLDSLLASLATVHKRMLSRLVSGVQSLA